MDKNYYYRMLGLTGEPTQAQIKKAYEQRMAKLHASDYRDDPEYAKKKMAEANMAYKVLIGAAPAVSKGRKERLEKPQVFAGSIGGVMERASQVKKTAAKNQKQAGVIIIVAISIMIFTFIGVFGGLVGSFDDYSGIQFETMIPADEAELIDDAQIYTSNLDYYGMLEKSTIEDNFDSVEWNMGVGEFGESELFDNTVQILSMLAIEDAEVFFNYVTGIEDYFYGFDDQDCARSLTDWMGAPQFEEVAGATNLYTNEIILTQADYLDYLGTVIYENQQN